MKCSDCPYCQYLSVYPNNSDEVISESMIWCDKVGGLAFYLGYCTERNLDKEEPHVIYPHKKKINKYERYLKHQNHLKYLDEVSCGYTKSVTYQDEIWTRRYGYVENPKPYYKRWYRGKISGYLKNQSNRRIRRYKGELHNGYQHVHKIYDYWWKLT